MTRRIVPKSTGYKKVGSAPRDAIDFVEDCGCKRCAFLKDTALQGQSAPLDQRIGWGENTAPRGRAQGETACIAMRIYTVLLQVPGRSKARNSRGDLRHTALRWSFLT